MTERDWLVATDPVPMLEHLGPRASDRRQRLFLSACCRRVWEFIPDRRTRDAIMAGERLADGRISEAARAAAELAVWDAREDSPGDPDCALDADVAASLISRRPLDTRYTGFATEYVAWLAMDGELAFDGLVDELLAEQCEILRDVFGDPFRPTPFDPGWLTSTVTALARGIYDARAFDRMPILADALEEAGCDDAGVLAHCRGDGPHVRGCWVVDLVLGKG